MSEIAISLTDVCKIFRVYPDLARSRIKQHVFLWKKYYLEKVALGNINLEVRKGEVVGVIGPNGAGKTTLLKIIAGISLPSSGEVFCSNRVIAVLALGLGFHPRLTGLENLELAGMMLGMTKKEVREKRRWIIEFSELGEYMDRPLTTYSTGMRSRLSFAVAACQEPDILIIDEALATGDIRFVQKCINRIHEIVHSGTTALFVSHNIWSIKRLTQRCILLDNGKIVDDGETNKVTDHYYEVMLKNEVFDQNNSRNEVCDFVGTGKVRLNKIKLEEKQGLSSNLVYSGEPAKFLLEILAEHSFSDVGLSLECWRSDGVCVFATGVSGGSLDEKNEFSCQSFDLKEGISTFVVEMRTVFLAPGDYYLNIHMFDSTSHSGYTSNEQFFFKTHVLEFGVRKRNNPNRGMVYYQPVKIYLTRGNQWTI